MKQLMLASCIIAVSMLSVADDFSVVTNGTEVTVTPLFSSGKTFTETYHSPEITKVIFSSDTSRQLTYAPNGIPTYEGGTEVVGVQMRIPRCDVFGSGNVILGGGGVIAALIAYGVDVTITNKVIFNNSDSYAMGYTGGNITLKSVGTNVGGYKTIRLGRVNAHDPSDATLSLTDPASEALNRINLQGACALKLDGGTIKALSTAYNPFFNVTTSGDVADISITTNGVTFEVPAGTTLHPGQPLKFSEVQQYVVKETFYPENWDFEEANSTWTFTCSGQYKDSTIKSMPSAWDGNGAYPPRGSRYAMLRQQTVLSTGINVPADGLWRVAFLRGCRAGFSSGMTLGVLVDGTTKHTFPALSGSSYDCSFTELVTEPFEMTSGSHTLAFSVSSAESTYSFNVDAVRLERVDALSIRGTLAKTGAGTMDLTGQDLSGAHLTAAEGTLALGSVTFDGSDLTVQSGAMALIEDSVINGAVSVAAGGTNRILNCTFGEDAVISVADGGVLVLSDLGVNLIANGSFEANGPQTYAAGTYPKGWTWDREEDLGTINGDGGLQGNGGTLSASGPYTPAGSVSAYLREACFYSQTVNCRVAGNYSLSLIAADRKLGHSEQMPVYLIVDGVTVATLPARESYGDYTRIAAEVPLTVGDHVIKIAAGKANTPALGNMVFIDDVRLRRIAPMNKITAGEFRLASGAELNLDLLDRLEVEAKFLVDGVEVRGRKSALAGAGVIVTGQGKIFVNDFKGFVISFK